MLKVLIIDDERNIRENLKTLIDWEEIGYTICGEADNGDDGLRKHNVLKPHLVIADIRMPGLHGLDMIKAIKKENKQVRILIVTGYSQFDYAKKAIDYGVDGYLLKPVDEDDLREKALVIKAEIKRICEEKELVEKSRNTFLEQFLSALIKGEEIEEKERSKWFSDCSLPWKSYQLFIVEIEKQVLLTQSQKNEMKNLIFNRMIPKIPGYILEVDGIITGLFKKKITHSSLNELKEIVKTLKCIIQKDITLYIGRLAESYEEIGEVYKHIKKVIDKSFFYKTSDIVFASRIFINKSDNGSEFSETDLIEQLYMAIDMNEENEITQVLTKLNKQILSSGKEEERVKSKYIGLFYSIIKRIAETREDMYYLLSEYEKIIQIIGEVRRINELFSIIKEKFLQISFELFATRPRENVIQRVKEYIDKYYNTNIKLKNLSELFHYNSAYFGQLFKEKTGRRFNTYIDVVRIEKAKDFLQQGMKVYEAAEQTGFTDVDNFYKKFKKYTGMSPSEYKKNKKE